MSYQFATEAILALNPDLQFEIVNDDIDNIHSIMLGRDTDITIGFVFHSRKYADGSSNLRIQFTKGRGQQYAKNSGLRIFRKHWISKKNEVSDKHVDYIKVNKNLNELKVLKSKKLANPTSDDFTKSFKTIFGKSFTNSILPIRGEPNVTNSIFRLSFAK